MKKRITKLYRTLKYLPLMFFCMSFIISLGVSFLLDGTYRTVAIITAAVIAVATVLIRLILRKRAIREIIIILPMTVGILFGTLWSGLYTEKAIDPSAELDGGRGKITAVVTEISYESEFLTTMSVRILSVDGEERRIDSVLSVPYVFNAEVNDLISCTCNFRRPENRADFSEEDYYTSEGVFILCEGEEDADVIGVDRSLPAFFRSHAADLSTKLKLSLGNYNGGFVSALLLGQRDSSPEKIATSFRYLGISHILSVSGLHIAMVMTPICYFCFRFIKKDHLAFLIPVLLGVGFILLVGAPYSAIRSLIVIIFVWASIFLETRIDRMTALFFSAFAVVFIDPSAIFSTSYILSVSAALGIVVLGAPCCSIISKAILDRNAFIRTFGAILMSACVTVAATLFTLPAVYFYYGEVSIVSVASNLLFVPICTLLLYLSLFTLIFYSTPISFLFSVPTSYVCSLTDRLSYSVSKVLPEPISIKYDFTVAVIALGAVSILVFIIIFDKRKRLSCLIVTSAVTVAAFCVGATLYSFKHSSDVTVLCVSDGGNDYFLLNKNGSTMLCDISDGSSSNLYRVASLSSELLHDASPDSLLLTHLHRKHINSVSRLCDNFVLRQIYIPMPTTEEEGYFSSALERVAADRGVDLLYYDAGSNTTFDFEGTRITLYKYAYLDRSVQPVRLIKIDGRRNLVYVGSSLTESSLYSELVEALAGDTHLWLGCHGPIIKEPLRLPYEVNSTFVSSQAVNSGYLTYYESINSVRKLNLN